MEDLASYIAVYNVLLLVQWPSVLSDNLALISLHLWLSFYIFVLHQFTNLIIRNSSALSFPT